MFAEVKDQEPDVYGCQARFSLRGSPGIVPSSLWCGNLYNFLHVSKSCEALLAEHFYENIKDEKSS